MSEPTSAPAGTAAAPRTAWRKSSYSLPEGSCVEVAEPAAAQVRFRDSKLQRSPVITASRASAAAFAAALASGTL